MFKGEIIQGNAVATLCKEISQKTNLEHVFGFNSGEDAILCAFIAAGIGEENMVILPSYCCETVAKAVYRCGALPLYCDIGEEFNPDVNHIIELINPNVRAIIFPHLFGRAGRIDLLESLLEQKGLRGKIMIIDDAAQSFGARLKGRLLGTFGDVGIVSFGPGKTMTASGGGLLMTRSDELADKIRKLPLGRVELSDKVRRLLYWLIFRRWRRFSLPFFPFLWRAFLGRASKSTRPKAFCNVDAAIALEQLRKLDRFLDIRVGRKRTVDRLLVDAGLKDQRCNEDKDVRSNVATKFTIRLDPSVYGPGFSMNYKEFMMKNGVEMLPLYTPIHMKNSYGKVQSSLKNTEQFWNRVLQVPLEPSMSHMDFQVVLGLLEQFFKTIKRDVQAEREVAH